MRTIKELLQVMQNNQEHFEAGLCIWIINLRTKGVISFDEKVKIGKYINKNTPKKKYKTTGYWWKDGNIKPRLKWIEKHIKLNS